MAGWVKQDWREFEEEVTCLVSAFGYNAITTQGSHDFGVDVIAESNRRRVLVQCKLFRGGRVGGPAIMQLVGTRSHFAATDAVCITTGTYSRQAREIAEQNEIRLVDKEMLIELCVTKRLTIPSLTYLVGTYGAFYLRDPLLRVGRLPHCDILLTCPSVSREHALFRRNNLALAVEDIGSKNGTYVNGIQVRKPISVTYGDSIRFGQDSYSVTLRV